MLIGLTGKARAGKDTVAARLVERHGFTRVAFADPLKAAALGLDPYVRVEDDEVGPLREACGFQAFHGSSYYRLSRVVAFAGWEAAKGVREVRRTLQRFGQEAVRENVADDAWITAAARTAGRILAEGGSVVITDVRYPNELDAIASWGGFHLHVDRPGLVSTDPHPSETALEPYYDDAQVVITNGGTLGDLGRAVDNAVAHLTHHLIRSAS